MIHSSDLSAHRVGHPSRSNETTDGYREAHHGEAHRGAETRHDQQKRRDLRRVIEATGKAYSSRRKPVQPVDDCPGLDPQKPAAIPVLALDGSPNRHRKLRRAKANQHSRAGGENLNNLVPETQACVCLDPEPAAQPAPTSAPTSACVVEIGIPTRVATSTVNAAPDATAVV